MALGPTIQLMDLGSKKMCRTCVSYDESPSLFVSLAEELVPGVAVLDALKACAPLEITESDGLPQHICEKCASTLQVAYTFQNQCVQVDQKLKALFTSRAAASLNHKEVNVKSEPDESLLKDEHSVDDDFFSNNIEIEIPKDEGNDTEKSYECYKCTKTYSEQKRFLKHLKKHDQDRHTCQICHKEFQKFTQLSRHLVEHKLYECSVCSQRFQNESLLIDHTAMHTLNIKVEPDAGFNCPECNKIFKSLKSVTSHIREHKRERKVTEEVKCDVCGKELSSPHLLTRHMKLHTGDRPYKCDKCSKSYYRKDQLVNHINKHNGTKPNTCPYCNKSFSQLCNLKDHVRTHTGETPYLCSECGRGFNNSSNLRQHVLRHTGVKPHSCTLCPKRFSTKGQMTSHMSTHTGAHPYVCDACGASFTKPNSLKKHNLIHLGLKPHECDVCRMRFTGKDHLKRHYRIHTGEKPYKCRVCERAFAQSNDLIKHMRQHYGRNVYQCTVCDMRFRLLSELKVHYPLHYIHETGAPVRNGAVDTLRDQTADNFATIDNNMPTVDNAPSINKKAVKSIEEAKNKYVTSGLLVGEISKENIVSANVDTRDHDYAGSSVFV